MGKRGFGNGPLGLIMKSTIPSVSDLAVLRNSTIYWPLLQNKTTSCKIAPKLTKYYLIAMTYLSLQEAISLFNKNSSIWASAHCLTSYTVKEVP